MICPNCGAYNSSGEKKCFQCKQRFPGQEQPGQEQRIPNGQQPPVEQQAGYGRQPAYEQQPYHGQPPAYGQPAGYGEPHEQWAPYVQQPPHMGQPIYVQAPVNRGMAALLALHLGLVGAHKFYIGKRSAGVMYLLFGLLGPSVGVGLGVGVAFLSPVFSLIVMALSYIALGIVAIASVVEGIHYLYIGENEFQRRYGGGGY